MGPTDFFEISARSCGFRQIAGLDEAGRGPLAGPVVAAVVLLPRRFSIDVLDDSKLLSANQREVLFDTIVDHAQAWAIGSASEQEIDDLNILNATKLAGHRAIHNLPFLPDYMLLDAIDIPSIHIPQRPIIKGDQLSISIASASILAKVWRDRIMDRYHEQFPDYHFHLHKGYPTPEHLKRLQQFGPCSGHRRSFRPVQRCLDT